MLLNDYQRRPGGPATLGWMIAIPSGWPGAYGASTGAPYRQQALEVGVAGWPRRWLFGNASAQHAWRVLIK